MSDPSMESLRQAATWYVAAFAAVGSIVLAGTQLAGVDLRKASSAVLAVTGVAIAVAAASLVVFLATRVLSPGQTLSRLAAREDRATRRLRRKTQQASPEYRMVASKDWLLNKIVTQELLSEKPLNVAQRIRAGDTTADAEAVAMVAAANRWRASRSFTQLKIVTPVASLVVLAGALCWLFFSMPGNPRPSAKTPVPVLVTLANGTNPSDLVGAGCTARELTGVALAGDIKSRPIVAMPPQQDCPGAVVLINPGTAAVTEVSP